MTRLPLLVLLSVSWAVVFAGQIGPRMTVRYPDAGYGDGTLLSDGGNPPGAVVVDGLSSTSCYCSTGGVAQVPLLDGGLLSAPRGATLRNCTGLGCQTKPCTTLWVGDGGDETWPSGCPLQ